jgi:large subunit ribosomal protein L1
MVRKVSKRAREFEKTIVRGQGYPLIHALQLVKQCANAKFDETVDVSINLGIDARKENVRGSTLLPHGTGKKVRIAVFAQGAQAQAAKDAGADIVGFEDLAEAIKGGQLDFDVLIASPEAMRLVGQLGQILGPRGLMPNPKVGTVSADVAGAVKNARSGQVMFKNDKTGIVQFSIGKASFAAESLAENLNAVISDVNKLKPSTAKGIYIKRISVSSTMGPNVLVESTVI